MERARAYDADPGTFLFGDSLRVFGASSARTSILSVTSTSHSPMAKESQTARRCRTTPGRVGNHSGATSTS